MLRIFKIGLFLIAAAIIMWSCEPDPSPAAKKSEFFIKLFGGLLQEEGFDIQQTSDGGYILIGSSNTPGISQNGNKDIYVIKVNATGNEEWTFSHGDGQDDVGKSILEKNSGGYILAGYHGFENGNTTAIVLELDAQGMQISEIIFSNDSSFSTGADDIKEIGVDQYLVTGITSDVNKNKGVIPGDTQDILTFILDGGVIITQTALGFGSLDFGVGGNPVFRGNNLIQDEYLIMGTAFNSPLQNQDQSTTSNNVLVFTVKLDNGSLTSPINGPTFGFPGTNQQASEIKRVNSAYAIVGTSDGAGQDVFFLKISDNPSNSEQIKTTIDLGGGDDEGVSVKQLIQGQFIIAGNTTSFSTGDKDIFLLRLDTDGSVFQDWITEPRTFGFSGDDTVGKVIVTNDGGYAIAGTITVDGSSPDDQNRNTMICLIKTDSEGKMGN
jgi:hypothetical protein